MQEQVSRQYVGIDLHPALGDRALGPAGKVLGTVRVDNDPVEFAMAMAEAARPRGRLEATTGTTGRPTCSKENGTNVHLVHPLGLHWGSRGVKNDGKDATELANSCGRRPA